MSTRVPPFSFSWKRMIPALAIIEPGSLFHASTRPGSRRVTIAFHWAFRPAGPAPAPPGASPALEVRDIRLLVDVELIVDLRDAPHPRYRRDERRHLVLQDRPGEADATLARIHLHRVRVRHRPAQR